MESIVRRDRRAERQPVNTGIDDRPAVVATSTGSPRRPAALRPLTVLVVLAISAVLTACGTGTGTTGTGTTTTITPPIRSTPTPEATSAPVAPLSVVMIIRHGEKPDGSHPGIDANGNQDDSSLTAVGWVRAHRLVDLFDPTPGLPRPGLARPTAIYATDANDNGEGQRTRETVTLLADKLGIPVNTSFGKGDEEALVEHVIAQPGPTLISWQHGEIPTIADAFPAVTPTPPSEWPDDRFDVVWTFTKTADGWQFAQIPELVLPQDEASVIRDCVGRCRPPGDSAPASPESLYDRTGVLVEVLDRLRQVAFTLGNHAERTVSEAAATGYVLETDDGTPAGDYTYEGRRLLADVAAGIEKATHIATEAHGALSHLKLA